ncbi:MAG: alanine--glyoxylate aminotransferase family protein [Acidimicrobiales bacterium]|nr:alanine--glyoxylate aminotransferase family protein [Acidimicrobiales bacterium]
MPLSDRTLMGPGPCNPYPEAIEALTRPMLGHLDPEFLALLDDVCARLRVLFGTENALTIPISGTGSAGMETCIVNVLGPGDVAVIGVNGVFGNRMCEVAARTGAEVVRVDFDWGAPVTTERLLDAHPSPTLIGMVHAETSTGARSDIAELGSGKGDALLLVDCVTSLGGIDFRADDWGVDLAYSGTQKCLGVPPGLSPVTVSDRARDRFVERSQSWYLDLRLIGNYVGTPGATRAYHHTAPISMIQSLRGGLVAIEDEGFDAVIERHADCGAAVQEGLQKLGFELFAEEGHRLPQLTSVLVPDGIDEAAVRSELLATYGLEIGGGLGEYAGKVWRIGCMGHTARRRNVATLLAALGELMG